MLSEDTEMEVYFDQYCNLCKHRNTALEWDSVCDRCLESPYNTNSHKPVNFEEKG